MIPLYIPATDTIIRNASQRYIHPQTNEIYGGTNYDSADKLAEIGAEPITMETVEAGYLATAWTVVKEDGSWRYRPTVQVDTEGLMSQAWSAADAHAGQMDMNSRSSLLWMAVDPACPEWRKARIDAVQQWWASVWDQYAAVKATIMSGEVAYYDPTVAGECPYTIWQIVSE